ncbi:formylglycine-generating enzyme family protein [Thiothrix subterranea]|uniref:formylglycine-generating enzyme family protein n=1 Tax=Thiothrix subterranea TaxID=2735563 RepID=UPI00192CB053|nr:formylglycine-generating enzyme family protein [Thiothrix subterranea]QQZ30679.1 formylglycine-generating enzyme family protein [Thiothrix subterranea]
MTPKYALKSSSRLHGWGAYLFATLILSVGVVCAETDLDKLAVEDVEKIKQEKAAEEKRQYDERVKREAKEAADKAKAAAAKAEAARVAELQQKCEKKGGDWKKGKCVMPQPKPPAPKPIPAPAPEPVAVVEPPASRPVAGNSQDMPHMLPIPAGTFTMGCVDGRDNVEGVAACGGDETPAHEVTISAFQMAKTETTVGQYMACVDVGVCPAPEWLEPNAPDYYKKLGTGLSDFNYPIVGVSWNDANTYAQWLSKETGKPYRLPTEAEWEYAARGGTDSAYPWGNKASHEFANYGKDECCDGLASGKDQWVYTAPVGSFAANGYGLQDMNGNVYEWVLDTWHSDYKGAPVDGSAWESGTYRVLRGGAWINDARNVRSANRDYDTPDDRSLNMGFRLVLS